MKYDYKLKKNALETLKTCANENALLHRIISTVIDKGTMDEWDNVIVELYQYFEEGDVIDRHKAVFCCSGLIGLILDEVIEKMEKDPKWKDEWQKSREKSKKDEKVKPHSPIFDLSTEKH